MRMRRTAICLAYAALAAALGAVPASAREDDEFEVKVVGSAYIEGLPESVALEEAREAAKRRAVEKGGRTLVQANTQVKNFELISDILLTQSQGVIKEMRWGKQWTEGRQIFIELTAVVKAANFESDVMAIEAILRNRGLPRIAMVVQEDVGTGLGKGACAAEIEDYFVQKGLRMMDEEAVQRAMARESEDLFDRPEMAQALARRLGVDIVVVGKVRAKPGPVEELYGIKTISHTLEHQFTVVDQHLGVKLATKRESFKTRACPESEAEKSLLAALESVGKNLGPRLLAQMLVAWTKSQFSIEIFFANATQSALNALQADLRTMGGQQTWVVRSLRSGQAVVDFHSQLPMDAIAAHLEAQKAVPLRITDRLESKLVCEIIGTPSASGSVAPPTTGGANTPGAAAPPLPEAPVSEGATGGAAAPPPSATPGKRMSLFIAAASAAALILGAIVIIVAVVFLRKKSP